MDYSDILQDISVDLSSMVKKHLKNIKKLDSKQQKQFGNLFGDMKQGIDDLSEGTYESVELNEAKDDYVARFKDTNIFLKKGYKHLNDDELLQLYLELGELISDNKLKVKNATLQFESVNEAKIAFVNDKLVGDRIQKSGLLPLLGDNNASLNVNKVKFTRELRDTLVKLYKKYSSLTVK